MVTVEIKGAERGDNYAFVSEVVGKMKMYRKGTDLAWYVDFQERCNADLAIANLETVSSIHSRIIDWRVSG